MESKLPASFDARDWANEFVQLVKENPSIATDVDTMVTWFSSAIMRGYDEALGEDDWNDEWEASFASDDD
jgi:hypothetical protein